ncbi:MAG: tRNA uridine-5-carboxymethylaminomethyl(34) synthesis GTPase MnmE [Clostridia bacterium]|nr:tRNA uridine-5-carboxymethylaminomethyl(34) synthesis GTPase MnmE [Clostridia bacterium]
MNENDTIIAIATPPGEGGIGILRLSGPRSEAILTKVFRRAGTPTTPWESHRLTYGFLQEGDLILDEGMAVLMRAPRSYTREDVAEIQLHGGSYVLQKGLELCLNQGARMAAPGEFTRRAFLNGRIDLSRAEAVMSLIAARGEQEHRAAIREMEGGVTAFVRGAADKLYEIQAGLAACVDYPEEISEEEGAAEMIPRLESLIALLEESIQERGSRLLHQGLRVALIGRPNVGKSSLLNALLGEEKAIVTPIPGTTRDLVQGEMTLGGVRVQITDTAGVRETQDEVEKIGVERSRRAMAEADVTLLALDGSQPLQKEDQDLIVALPEQAAILINKQDLPQQIALPEQADILPNKQDQPQQNTLLETGHRLIPCSAKNPETLRPVKDYLREFTALSDQMAVTQPRHLDALKRAVGFLREALETVQTLPPDLAATDLQAAQQALGEITGDQVDEKLLDKVFSSFCVGK